MRRRQLGFSSALARSRSASGTARATRAAISELRRRRRSDDDGSRPSSANFTRRYPDIEVKLTLDDSFADILGEGFDVAIRGGPAVDSGFMGRRLFEMRRVVVASPAYLAERRAPERLEDLARHRCLVFNNGRHFHADWRFGRGAGARSVRVEGALATNNSELPVVWALAELGLAQKSLWEVAEPLARGALVTVLNDFEPDPATFFAIHPVSRSSRKIGLFVEELARFLAPNLCTCEVGSRRPVVDLHFLVRLSKLLFRPSAFHRVCVTFRA